MKPSTAWYAPRRLRQRRNGHQLLPLKRRLTAAQQVVRHEHMRWRKHRQWPHVPSTPITEQDRARVQVLRERMRQVQS